MTRKHFEDIAESFRIELEFQEPGSDAYKAVHRVANWVANDLRIANPHFDKERFLRACEPKERAA